MRRRVVDHPFVQMSDLQRWVIVAAFGVYVLLVALARSQDPTPTDDWIPAILAIYVLLTAAPLLLLRETRGWFHPLIALSLLTFLDLARRFWMYAWGLDWHVALPASRDELSLLIERQLWLQCLAVTCVYAGYVLGPRMPLPRMRFEMPRLLVPKLLVVVGISFAAFLAFIIGQGGLTAHFDTWSTGRHAQLAGQHYQLALANLALAACWVWLAYRRDATRSLLFWGAALGALVAAFLMTGSRSSLVYPALVGFVVWMLREQKVAYLRTVGLAVVALYVVTTLGNFRRSTWGGSADWESASEGSVVENVTQAASGELAERATIADGTLPILARVPDDVPLLEGSSYLAVLSLPIPRALWPGKPGMVDGQVGHVFFHIQAGVPAGGIGEAYWNFHVPGVVAVFLLFGMWLRWLGRLYTRHRASPPMIVMYGITLLLFRDPSGLSFVTCMIAVAQAFVVLLVIGAVPFGRRRARGVGLPAPGSAPG
jgi:hypothetical protein